MTPHKHILLLAIILSVLLGGAIFVNFLKASVTTTRVNWLFDVDEGLSKSQNDKKCLLLFFYAEWCGWCLRFDKDINENTTVASFLNEKLICVKVDIETNGAFAHDYRITTIPQVVLLSDAGDELGRIVGYQAPTAFLEELSNILDH